VVVIFVGDVVDKAYTTKPNGNTYSAGRIEMTLRFQSEGVDYLNVFNKALTRRLNLVSELFFD
jgi:hypothetical protein